MKKTYRIAAIPGDGIGKEVLPEGIRVLQAAAQRWDLSLSFEQMEWASCEYYAHHGKMMPDDWREQLQGFDAGADGYLTKPISMKLLISRVQAILKRVATEDTPAEEAPSITIDSARHTVQIGSTELTLPRKEFALLELLASRPDELITREEIYTKIWGQEVVVGDRTIDVHIRKLRQKIGDEHIRTIKGVGYLFKN